MSKLVERLNRDAELNRIAYLQMLYPGWKPRYKRVKSHVLKITIPSESMLTWESQVHQYPETGVPGLSYFKGQVDGIDDNKHVDCLLYRDDDGKLVGILNYYAFYFHDEYGDIIERPGNCNLFVHPEHRRKGIGSKLLTEADSRWQLNFSQQAYSPEGAAVVERYLKRGRKCDKR